MQNISEIIQSCEWFPSNFLVISENVFSPLLYYSYFGAAVPTILIGILFFLNGKGKLENKLLFLTALSFVLWIFGALVTWATEFPKYTMFFWSSINIIEPFVYFFAFYFVYVFFLKKDFSLTQKIIFSLPLIPTIILGSTKLNLLGYNLSNCDRNAYEGILASYGYVLEILYALLIVIIAIIAYRRVTDKISKRKIVLVTVGITLFLLSFSLGNILEVFTENWYIGQYGLFGAPIFMAFLTFMIVRFKAFDIKLIGSQALVWVLIILISSEFFFVESNINRILIGITLILSAIVGLIIIRSVKKEIAQREELAVANENQQLLIRFITHQVKGFFTKSKMIFASIIEGDMGDVSEPLKSIVKEGLESDNKAVEMVQEVLKASSLRSGQMTYNLEDVDVGVFVKEIAEGFREVAVQKGLNYEVNVPDHNIKIKLDKLQMTQVYKNLIDNSIKYTTTGYVKVDLKIKPDTVLFSIHDSGVGLSDGDKAKLFREGGRGEESLKLNVNSTGYGLFIVKKIVEGHNGKIWAASAGRGHGSQFYVELKLIK